MKRVRYLDKLVSYLLIANFAVAGAMPSSSFAKSGVLDYDKLIRGETNGYLSKALAACAGKGSAGNADLNCALEDWSFHNKVADAAFERLKSDPKDQKLYADLLNNLKPNSDGKVLMDFKAIEAFIAKKKIKSFDELKGKYKTLTAYLAGTVKRDGAAILFRQIAQDYGPDEDRRARQGQCIDFTLSSQLDHVPVYHPGMKRNLFPFHSDNFDPNSPVKAACTQDCRPAPPSPGSSTAFECHKPSEWKGSNEARKKAEELRECARQINPGANCENHALVDLLAKAGMKGVVPLYETLLPQLTQQANDFLLDTTTEAFIQNAVLLGASDPSGQFTHRQIELLTQKLSSCQMESESKAVHSQVQGRTCSGGRNCEDSGMRTVKSTVVDTEAVERNKRRKKNIDSSLARLKDALGKRPPLSVDEFSDQYLTDMGRAAQCVHTLKKRFDKIHTILGPQVGTDYTIRIAAPTSTAGQIAMSGLETALSIVPPLAVFKFYFADKGILMAPLVEGKKNVHGQTVQDTCGVYKQHFDQRHLDGTKKRHTLSVDGGRTLDLFVDEDQDLCEALAQTVNMDLQGAKSLSITIDGKSAKIPPPNGDRGKFCEAVKKKFKWEKLLNNKYQEVELDEMVYRIHNGTRDQEKFCEAARGEYVALTNQINELYQRYPALFTEVEDQGSRCKAYFNCTEEEQTLSDAIRKSKGNSFSNAAADVLVQRYQDLGGRIDPGASQYRGRAKFWEKGRVKGQGYDSDQQQDHYPGRACLHQDPLLGWTSLTDGDGNAIVASGGKRCEDFKDASGQSAKPEENILVKKETPFAHNDGTTRSCLEDLQSKGPDKALVAAAKLVLKNQADKPMGIMADAIHEMACGDHADEYRDKLLQSPELMAKFYNCAEKPFQTLAHIRDEKDSQIRDERQRDCARSQNSSAPKGLAELLSCDQPANNKSYAADVSSTFLKSADSLKPWASPQECAERQQSDWLACLRLNGYEAPKVSNDNPSSISGIKQEQAKAAEKAKQDAKGREKWETLMSGLQFAGMVAPQGGMFSASVKGAAVGGISGAVLGAGMALPFSGHQPTSAMVAKAGRDAHFDQAALAAGYGHYSAAEESIRKFEDLTDQTSGLGPIGQAALMGFATGAVGGMFHDGPRPIKLTHLAEAEVKSIMTDPFYAKSLSHEDLGFLYKTWKDSIQDSPVHRRNLGKYESAFKEVLDQGIEARFGIQLKALAKNPSSKVKDLSIEDRILLLKDPNLGELSKEAIVNLFMDKRLAGVSFEKRVKIYRDQELKKLKFADRIDALLHSGGVDISEAKAIFKDNPYAAGKLEFKTTDGRLAKLAQVAKNGDDTVLTFEVLKPGAKKPHKIQIDLKTLARESGIDVAKLDSIPLNHLLEIVGEPIHQRKYLIELSLGHRDAPTIRESGKPASSRTTTAKSGIDAAGNGTLPAIDEPSAAKLIKKSTPEHYSVQDPANEKFGAAAEVDRDGVLGISIRTVAKDGKQRSAVLTGKDEFAKILKHFDGKFDAIRGDWSFGDNIAEFNRLMGPPHNLDMNEAAKKTWTGKLATEAGYTEIEIEESLYKRVEVPGKHGKAPTVENVWTEIRVVFRKPKGRPDVVKKSIDAGKFKATHLQIERNSTRNKTVQYVDKTFKTKDLNWSWYDQKGAAHFDPKQPGSQFNTATFKDTEAVKDFVSTHLPSEIRYEAVKLPNGNIDYRAEFTIDLTHQDGMPTPVGWSKVMSLEDLKKNYPGATYQIKARGPPGGTPGEFRGQKGLWYPETDVNRVPLKNPDGSFKNPRGSFVPETNVVELPSTPQTNKITVVISEDPVKHQPKVLTVVPGDNAPAQPSFVDAKIYKADTLAPDSIESRYWKDHVFAVEESPVSPKSGSVGKVPSALGSDATTPPHPWTAPELADWKKYNDAMGDSRYRLLGRDQDALRAELGLKPNVPIPEHVATQRIAEMAQEFNLAQDAVLKRLEPKLKELNTKLRALALDAPTDPAALEALKGEIDALRAQAAPDHAELASVMQSYFMHRGVPTLLEKQADGSYQIVLAPEQAAKGMGIEKPASSLTRLATNSSLKGHRVGFSTNYATNGIAEAVPDNIVILPWRDTHVPGVISSVGRHEYFHNQIKRMRRQAQRGGDAGKESPLISVVGSKRLRKREAKNPGLEMYRGSYQIDEAGAYGYQSISSVATAHRHAGLYYELLRDPSPQALEATRAFLAKETGKPLLNYDRAQLLEFLKYKTQYESKGVAVYAATSKDFIEAGIMDLKETYVEKLSMNGKNANVFHDVADPDIYFIRLESGPEVGFSCSQVRAGCTFKDEADFRRAVQDHLRDEMVRLNDLKNKLTQAEAEVGELSRWTSQADPARSAPPGFKPRLEAIKKRFGGTSSDPVGRPAPASASKLVAALGTDHRGKVYGKEGQVVRKAEVAGEIASTEYHYSHELPGQDVSLSVSGTDSYAKIVPKDGQGGGIPVKVQAIWTDGAGKTHVRVLVPQFRNGKLLSPDTHPPVVRELGPDEIVARSESAPKTMLAYEAWFDRNGPIRAGPRGEIEPDYRPVFRSLRNADEHTVLKVDSRIEALAEEVLYDYQSSQRAPPVIFDPSREPGAGKRPGPDHAAQQTLHDKGEWAKHATRVLDRNPGEWGDAKAELGPIGKSGVSGNPIYRVVLSIKGKAVEKVFRPIGDQAKSTTAARKILAAAVINEWMGLATVPRSRLAKINGKFGVVSDIAPGYVGAAVDLSKVDPASFSDAKSFEFLIGQTDGHHTNFHVGGDVASGRGQVSVFDHNLAFDIGVNKFRDGGRTILGPDLPDLYTRHFVEQLKALDQRSLRKTVGAHLTELELESILFRRDVILKDIELRTAKGQKIYVDEVTRVPPASARRPIAPPKGVEIHGEVQSLEPKVAEIHLEQISSRVSQFCESCPNINVNERTIKHSNQHYPGDRIQDVRDAQRFARQDRSTTVFSDGTSVDDIISEMGQVKGVAFDKKAQQLMAEGSDTIAFDVEIIRQTARGPEKFKVKIVTCIKEFCADEAGGVMAEKAFKRGDAVSVFPICGPNVMMIPKAAKVAGAVAKYNPKAPLGTGMGKLKVVHCD